MRLRGGIKLSANLFAERTVCAPQKKMEPFDYLFNNCIKNAGVLHAKTRLFYKNCTSFHEVDYHFSSDYSAVNF